MGLLSRPFATCSRARSRADASTEPGRLKYISPSSIFSSATYVILISTVAFSGRFPMLTWKDKKFDPLLLLLSNNNSNLIIILNIIRLQLNKNYK
jgi:hypothetical protein